MDFYYLRGSYYTPLDSPGLRILGVTVMGMITISVGLAVGLVVFRKWRERTWGWCTCATDMTGKVRVFISCQKLLKKLKN
jgi:hypothetical protein